MNEILKRLLRSAIVSADRKHCGPDDEDRARIAAIEAELNAPIEKAARDGAARSAGKLKSDKLTGLQKAVLEAQTALGDKATDADILAHLKDTKRIGLNMRKYDITRTRRALLRRFPPQT